jgi:hypothetical protein
VSRVYCFKPDGPSRMGKAGYVDPSAPSQVRRAKQISHGNRV